MENRFVTYFEVTYKNAIAGYMCIRPTSYRDKLAELKEIYPDLQLVYREWSDGVVENGVIEKEDWNIG